MDMYIYMYIYYLECESARCVSTTDYVPTDPTMLLLTSNERPECKEIFISPPTTHYHRKNKYTSSTQQ